MSVVGKSIKDTTPVEAYQPVSPVNPTTGVPITPVSGNADGSQNIGGADGANKASLTNPAPVVAELQFNTTRPTIASGGYAPLQATNRGSVYVTIGDTGLTTAGLLAGSADGNSGNLIGLLTSAFNLNWNGSTWDRQRGSVAPVAAVGVTAQLLKSSAGYFSSASMVAGATAGFFILYNSNSIPAGGSALTAAATLLAVPVAASGYATLGGDFKDKICSTGVVLLFSTSLTTYTVPANAAAHMQGSAY